METTNFILIYDKDCPLCKWYTGIFVKYGFLKEGGRVSFDVALNQKDLIFDETRSKNKIALIHQGDNAVSYGIDSLLIVLGTKFRWIEKTGKLPGIYHFLTLLYSFISYNRKVIAPSACTGSCDCIPSRSYFWRIAFIALGGLFVNFATWIYFNQHLELFYIASWKYTDLVFFGSQFLFQYVIFILLKQKNFYDYAGQIAFISFLGAVLLYVFHIGLNILHQWNIEITLLEPLCYGIVYMFMLQLHAKRIKILGFTAWMSVSWIIFRFAIYPFAFRLV